MRAHLVGLCLSFVACGPGSQSPDSGSGEADAGSLDAGGQVSGATVLRPDDELLPDLSTVALIPGLAQCLKLSVVRSDGTRAPIDSSSGLTLEVVSAAPDVVVATQPGDCPTSGFLALGVGGALVQVKASDGVVTLRRSIDVSVLAGTLSLGAYRALSIGLGTVGRLWYAFDRRASNGAPLSTTATTLPRLLSSTITTPGVVEFLGPGSYRSLLDLRGAGLGTTNLQLHYTFGTTVIDAAQSTIKVVPTAPVTSVTALSLVDGVYAGFSKLEPHTCTGVVMVSSHQGPMGSYSLFLPPTSVESLSSDAVVDGQALCVGTRGEARLRACVEGRCTTAGVPVFSEADLLEVKVVPAAPLSLTSSSGPQSLCLPVTARAKFSDGSTRDLFADWSTTIDPLQSADPWAQFTRQFQGDSPVETAEGYPCVTVSPFNTRGSTRSDRLIVSWGRHGTNGPPSIELLP